LNKIKKAKKFEFSSSSTACDNISANRHALTRLKSFQIQPSPTDLQQGISNVKSPLAALSAQLDGLMLRDRQRLQRRLQGAKKTFK
jgi:hypothetical protein